MSASRPALSKSTQSPSWSSETSEVLDFLDSLSSSASPGQFRFCSEGELLPRDSSSGLFCTCFSMRIAWQTGIWKLWSEEKRSACVDFIKGFQNSDGYFQDKWILSHQKISWRDIALLALGKKPLVEITQRKTRAATAESRQAVACLAMVGAAPKERLPLTARSQTEADAYFSSLGWGNPWAAASHLSHQIVFSEVNKQHFESSFCPIEIFLENLREIFNENDGCWYRSSPSDNVKVGGAMKVLGALKWIDRVEEFASPALLQFVLQTKSKGDGCSFLNRLFVLHELRNFHESSSQENAIRGEAEEALEKIARFKARRGKGYSFFEGRSQTHYYGTRVSEGLPVGDLHGTMMVVWGALLAHSILENTLPDGWSHCLN